MASRYLLALCALGASASTIEVEWNGIFNVNGNAQTWIMQKVGGSYADQTMRLVLYSHATSATDGTMMEAVEDAAKTIIAQGPCTIAEDGDTLTPATAGACFELHVGTTAESTWTIDTTGVTSMSVFAQHVPTEFEDTKHYLKEGGATGTDVEPVAEEGGGGHGHGHDHGGGDDGGGGAHAGHDHGDTAKFYEWAGVFAVPETTYTWIMQKVGGSYADATMKIVIMPSAADASAKDAKESAAKKLFEGTCDERDPGSTMAPAASGTCFDLHVDDTIAESTWTIDATSIAGITVYTQHVPTEFEDTKHFFKTPDANGEDVETVPFTKRWGMAIGAGFIVNIVTFAGVVFLVPGMSKFAKEQPGCFWPVLNAFGSGALIACAFYLMFPEGYLYIATGGAEANTAFFFGTMVLIGVISASVFDFVVSLIMGGKPAVDATATKDVEGGATEVAAQPAATRARVLSAVLIGDFMHNYCDGIFIGVGFTSCSNTLAWTITVSTFIHEIAQELADYVVLTDPKQGNLKPMIALILNFVSGLSIILGIITVMAQDNVDPRALGCLLTFGGGIYIQIGLAEMLPRVYNFAHTAGVKAGAMFAFCMGALAIGAILYNHKHCIAEDDDSHAGHDHGRRLMEDVLGFLTSQ